MWTVYFMASNSAGLSYTYCPGAKYHIMEEELMDFALNESKW